MVLQIIEKFNWSGRGYVSLCGISHEELQRRRKKEFNDLKGTT